MKKNLLLTALTAAFLSFVLPASAQKNQQFTNGEELTYRLHYGFINAGEATIKVHENLYRLNDRICQRVEVAGRSTGAFDHVLRIRDSWLSYMDTTNYMPHKAVRNIEEGKYHKHEETFFDYTTKVARIEEADEETRKVSIAERVFDMVSGYTQLRLINYDRLQKNDTIRISGMHEDKVYKMKIVYRGKARVKTKFGKVSAYVISPVMPKNKLFDGENSIRVWLSDDGNRIPLKIQADMFVGAVEVDLKSYKRLRNPTQLKADD
jgi:hypothetical protein